MSNKKMAILKNLEKKPSEPKIMLNTVLNKKNVSSKVCCFSFKNAIKNDEFLTTNFKMRKFLLKKKTRSKNVNNTYGIPLVSYYYFILNRVVFLTNSISRSNYYLEIEFLFEFEMEFAKKCNSI